MSSKMHSYLIESRLSDVLALIQVLALSPKTRRSEEGLVNELQGKPKSGKSWIEVSGQHREFFRVKPTGETGAHVSLVARNVQEPVPTDNGNEIRPLLSTDTTAKLMQLAIDLHAKQTQSSEAWKTIYIPIVIALLAATASISAAFISASLKDNRQCLPTHSTLSSSITNNDKHPESK